MYIACLYSFCRRGEVKSLTLRAATSGALAAYSLNDAWSLLRAALHSSCTSLTDPKLVSTSLSYAQKHVLSLNIVFNDTQVTEENSALDS